MWPYNPETSTVDLRNLRSTDLPFNSFVHMPPPLREEEEIRYQNLKRDLVGVVKKYIGEVKADTEFNNLSESEMRYAIRIKERP